MTCVVEKHTDNVFCFGVKKYLNFGNVVIKQIIIGNQ